MIRFFSKLRQKFLAQGRVVRYITYAVGEMVLVVMGILIACTSPGPWRGVPAHNSINL